MPNVAEQIYKSGLKFLVPLNIDETYKLIVREAMRLTNAQYGSILLERDGELERVYASDPILYKIKPRRRGITWTVYKTKKPQIMTSREIKKIHPEFEETRARSDIIVPLSNQNKSIGVLTVQSLKDKNFTKNEFNILQLFGPMASLAIRKNQLYDEIKQALETRDLFISMAAHELRTPLTTINGYVQLLHSRIKKFNEQESKWIEELSWEVLRLSILVQELLAVEKIKQRELQYFYKKCHLGDIVLRSIKNTSFQHISRQIDFENSLKKDQDIIEADFDKVLQVIDNIIENACKYSPVETPVTINLIQKEKQLLLSIKDQGKGIPKNEIKNAFEKFQRGTNHTREGMGLGLFLSKEIIKMHKGQILIESKEGVGTTVTVSLPKFEP